jgi:CheY-like chemotaxis protein
LRILLVDDDLPSVDALRELLEYAGHDVLCAENGREALDCLREAGGIDLILLDLMMPVMDGYEFRSEQLEDPDLASIPVVVLTADGHAREKARALHTDRYLQKPLSPKKVLGLVQADGPSS